MAVETDDGRHGTAIYEITGRHHHRFFSQPLPTDHGADDVAVTNA
jgi:hypothetical protein